MNSNCSATNLEHVDDSGWQRCTLSQHMDTHALDRVIDEHAAHVEPLIRLRLHHEVLDRHYGNVL